MVIACARTKMMEEENTSLKEQFSELSDRLGYRIFLTEEVINYYGYLFLYGQPNLEKALFYFTYNTQNYPLSSNAWDSLAEAYKVKGDKKKAILYYKKALELNPKDEGIKKRLEELTH